MLRQLLGPPTQLDLNWRMLGIPICVKPWFWLAAVILAFAGSGEETNLHEVLIWVVCLFVSLIIHEYGHALTAKRFKARNVNVVIYHMGGVAIHEGGPTPKQRIIELIMGPGAGFIFYGVLLLGMTLIGYDLDEPFATTPTFWQDVLWRTLHALTFINLWWGLVNLIPVYPLDGGQIAQTVLMMKKPLTGIELSHRLSIIFACVAIVGFLAWGLYEFFVLGQKFNAWYPILVFAVLAYLNYQLSKVEYVQATRESYNQQPRQPWEQDPDWWKKG